MKGKKFECPECKKLFGSKQALIVHQRMKHGQNRQIEPQPEQTLEPEEMKQIKEMLPKDDIWKLYEQMEARELKNLLIEDLRLRIEERRKRLREISEKEPEKPRETAKEVESLVSLVRDILKDVKEKGTDKDLLKKIEALESKLSLAKAVDEKSLRLEEIRVNRELKEKEIENQRYLTDRIADSIDKLTQNIGKGLGLALTGEAGSKQMILVGNEVKALCPKCACEFSVSVEKAQKEGITCPMCGKQITQTQPQPS